MKKIAVVVFLVSAALAGCHHKKADTTGGNTMGSGSAMGSAAGSASGSAAGSGSAM